MKAKFDKWAATEEGREVRRQFIRLACGLRKGGFSHFGAKAIVERIRWHMAIKHRDENNRYKINNNYTAYLARDAEAHCPELDGFFRNRFCKGYGDAVQKWMKFEVDN